MISAVGVQRLGAAENGRHRLDGDADDVVQRLLGGQRLARGLSVELQPLRRGRFGVVPLLHHAGVDAARGPELRDLLEHRVVGVEEEG